VDFSVLPGEVHALLGENGAGKSTLMNILAGVHTKDAGTVTFDGKALENTTVQSSENAGIAFVHQELNLFNDMKVYENIFLRKEITRRWGALDKRAMLEKSHELFQNLGVDIDPALHVSDLDISKKQLLEIAKALFANAKLFILDEPTTALNNTEIEHLFGIISRLRQIGKSFIFISHKMNEVFTIADRYTVLRNGELVKTGVIRDTTPREVTRLMVGGKYSDEGYYAPRAPGELMLELKDLSGKGFQHVNLSIRRGEVIGFTGLRGAGISELLQTIFGFLPISGGELLIRGRPVRNHSIHAAMAGGLAMIAANRKENSVIPDLTLLDNFYISEHTLSSRRPYINTRREIVKYRAHRDALDIRANDPFDLITSLSGGNQQKVMLARWLNINAEILLMDNPTQGIDVGAKAELYKLILQLAAQG
jgi:ribose transport system ATP-binding protein